MPRLSFIAGDRAGEHSDFEEGIVIGRVPPADLVLEDGLVSRRHAAIENRDGRFFLVDLGSANGTLLNGEPVASAVALDDDDVLDIGVSRLQFSGGGLPSDVEESDEGPESSPIDVEQSVIVDLAEMTGRMQALDESDGQAERLRVRLEFLEAVSQILGETVDEGELLSRVLDLVLETMPAVDRAFVVLCDEQSEDFVPRLGRTRSGENTEIAISRTVLRKAIGGRQAILTPDIAIDESYVESLSAVNIQLHSVVCVPLIAGDRVFGALQIDNSAERRQFTQEDLLTFTSAAAAIAQALANAWLHQELVTQRMQEHDLALARRIQHDFLPTVLPALPGYGFAAHYRAAAAVGGDLYDVLELAGGTLRIALGDVSGKGVSAALLMARLMSDLRYLGGLELGPTEVLEQIDQQLVAHGGDGMFATMVYLDLEPATGEVALVNAGHLPVLLRRAGGTVERIMAEGGASLGLSTSPRPEPERFRLEPGDCFLLYSDGLMEAADGEGRRLGLDRLQMALAAEIETAEQLIELMVDLAERWVSTGGFDDDFTMVGVARSSLLGVGDIELR
jgi:serine phosphatase RsbU (regulator of sigma subunit)/pSer/pThr/pTyr-binding forkhead associated (FHA) protein